MASAAEHEAHPHAHASAGRYIVSVLVLYVCTVLTYWLSLYDFGIWSFVIAMIIACTKGTVVALFFMHLWDHRGANRLVFGVSLIFLALAITMVLVDHTTRFPLALPPH